MLSLSVVFEKKNGIGIITLNEPDSLNALSSNLKSELLDCLEDVEQSGDVRIVILTGSGKAFCAGGDIRGMGKRTTLESVDKIANTTKVIVKIAELKKPVIAAVNGYAMGAGFSLALAADIIVAQRNAKFGLSFVNVGLIPDCGLLYFLPKLVGPWKAKELIFSGAVLTAEEAFQYGIVNQLVGENEALQVAVTKAEQLSKGPTQTMEFVKSILNQSEHLDLRGTIQFENYAQSVLQQTEDHLEGVHAFREKRAPLFRGK